MPKSDTIIGMICTLLTILVALILIGAIIFASGTISFWKRSLVEVTATVQSCNITKDPGNPITTFANVALVIQFEYHDHRFTREIAYRTQAQYAQCPGSTTLIYAYQVNGNDIFCSEYDPDCPIDWKGYYVMIVVPVALLVVISIPSILVIWYSCGSWKRNRQGTEKEPLIVVINAR